MAAKLKMPFHATLDGESDKDLIKWLEKVKGTVGGHTRALRHLWWAAKDQLKKRREL